MKPFPALGSLLVAGLVANLACGGKAPPPPDKTVRQFKHVIAKQLAPNVMMLLNKSGSMLTNTSIASPCPSTIGGCGPGAPCPAGCPTRISDLQESMNQFLTNQGTVARFGVSTFPKDSACSATSGSEVLAPLPAASLSDDLAALQAQANQANSAIAALVPSGGKPIADSLRFVGALPELTDPDRQNFVLLVTDGLPNCNANNPNTCANASACQCTTSACTTANGLCTLGCLDADGTVAAVSELRAKAIKTIVIGLGADVATGVAADTLNRMADAGGFARACPMGTDAECGTGDTCDAALKLCQRRYFQANDAPALTAALAQITSPVPSTGPSLCTFTLDATPSSPDKLKVLVNGQVQSGCTTATGCDTWTLDLSNGVARVTFHGAMCTQLQNASVYNPTDLEFDIAP